MNHIYKTCIKNYFHSQNDFTFSTGEIQSSPIYKFNFQSSTPKIPDTTKSRGADEILRPDSVLTGSNLQDPTSPRSSNQTVSPPSLLFTTAIIHLKKHFPPNNLSWPSAPPKHYAVSPNPPEGRPQTKGHWQTSLANRGSARPSARGAHPDRNCVGPRIKVPAVIYERRDYYA